MSVLVKLLVLLVKLLFMDIQNGPGAMRKEFILVHS
jgi:hypothetical protein